ncbi:hypothetical protein POX_f07439 [Penicillium oxalicum]|uniref:hypothetical protein n=1 Tax=Penicillium oxalicum TaxID=69781 RepID=UPI0020B64DAF|nr:hypothetical protein POX_f07439 [Penicillium oxalicum]KAI2787082.1 hypothetical protein POX_f07439 [Penicillium oxalicum]
MNQVLFHFIMQYCKRSSEDGTVKLVLALCFPCKGLMEALTICQGNDTPCT